MSEQDSIGSNLFAKNLVLHLKIFDDHFLLFAYMLDEYGNEYMQRLEKK